MGLRQFNLSATENIINYIIHKIVPRFILHHVVNLLKALEHTKLLGPCLTFHWASIIQIHQIHRTVSNICKKRHACKILQILCHCRVTLWHNRTSGKLNTIKSVLIADLHTAVPEHISLKILPLCLHPFEWQTDCQMNPNSVNSICDSPCFQLLYNSSKCQHIIIVIGLLICHKPLSSLSDDIIITTVCLTQVRCHTSQSLS